MPARLRAVAPNTLRMLISLVRSSALGRAFGFLSQAYAGSPQFSVYLITGDIGNNGVALIPQLIEMGLQ